MSSLDKRLSTLGLLVLNDSKESDDNNDYQLVISNDSNDHMTSNDNEHNVVLKHLFKIHRFFTASIFLAHLVEYGIKYDKYD